MAIERMASPWPGADDPLGADEYTDFTELRSGAATGAVMLGNRWHVEPLLSTMGA